MSGKSTQRGLGGIIPTNLKEGGQMINDVRIYDGQGRLKATIKPELVLNPHGFAKKFEPHICRSPRCYETTTNRHYCSDRCRKSHRYLQKKAKNQEKKRLEQARPKRHCTNRGCNKVLTARRPKFCSKVCCADSVRRRLKKRELENRKLLKQIKAGRKKGAIR